AAVRVPRRAHGRTAVPLSRAQLAADPRGGRAGSLGYLSTPSPRRRLRPVRTFVHDVFRRNRDTARRTSRTRRPARRTRRLGPTTARRTGVSTYFTSKSFSFLRRL